jgi:1-acyl-sn-glycerol-3-phosphate acyltransferase
MFPEPPLESLSRFERTAVRLVARMQHPPWQPFWFRCQRGIGARWIGWLADPLLEVHGLGLVQATSRERPLLVVANHRTMWDLYVMMSVLFRRIEGWRSILFPVRGRYFYQRPGGLLLNGSMAFWSMFPPFFHERRKVRFDQWSLQVLADLAREGAGRLIGFHPEGTRNKDPDPYSFLEPQPGIGRLIHMSWPIVVPLFIAGLPPTFREVLGRRIHGGEPYRLWFGPALDFRVFQGTPPTAATYRSIAGFVMAAIRGLGDEDRARHA